MLLFMVLEFIVIIIVDADFVVVRVTFAKVVVSTVRNGVFVL